MRVKNIVLVLCTAIVAIACDPTRSSFTIEGTTNLVEGTKVYLEKQSNTSGILKIDSTEIKDNTFILEGHSKGVELYTVRFNTLQGGFYVIGDKGDIKVTVNNDTLSKSEVTGTYNNDELRKFNAAITKSQKELLQFEKNNIQKLQEATKANNTALVSSLQSEYAALQNKLKGRNLEYVQTHPKSFVSVMILESMLKEFEPNYVKIKQLFNGIADEMKTTTKGRFIQSKLQDLEAVAIGQKAPAFSAPTPDGTRISLQENLGKVTVLYFGGSWCEPCKAQNEFYNSLYSEFHAKGLNLLQVSLEIKGQREEWKKSIQEQKIIWPSVSNLDYWKDPVAKLYSIDGFPAVFILDEKGTIVAKNLEGQALKAKIKALLKL